MTLAVATEQGTADGCRMCCIGWCGAEESSSDCHCNAMEVQMGSRQNRDYEYIQVTWGIKIAKFLVEMEQIKQVRRKWLVNN